MTENIVTEVLNQHFDGKYVYAAKYFGVSAPAFRKWEEQREFPAKSGRMYQAHVLTGLSYETLTPSIFKLPDKQVA